MAGGAENLCEVTRAARPPWRRPGRAARSGGQPCQERHSKA
jgi:hypothetical protein